jgi:hypothetical protein
MELIEKRILSTAQTEIPLTGPWSQYTDLEIYLNAYFTASAGADGVQIQFNNDTGNNYSVYYFESLKGTGINANGSAAIGGMWVTYRPSGSTDIPISARIRIFDINRTDVVKHMVSRYGGGSETYFGTYNGAWENTQALSSIKFIKGAGSSQFLAGTTLSIYGVKA